MRVFVHGRFDNLNLGHRVFLEKARKYGDCLTVFLNDWQKCDQTYEERQNALISISCVDNVVKETDSDVFYHFTKECENATVVLGEHDRALGASLTELCIPVQYVSSGIPSIPYLVISIGQACNLKCRDCGILSPYAPQSALLYDISSIINDLSIIAKNCDTIDRLQIQGGEPFLHPNLVDLLDSLLEQKPFINCIKKIEIATNGTIVPASNVLERMCNDKLFVRISNYSNLKQIKPNVTETIACLDEHKIKYRIYNFTSRRDLWYRKGDFNISPELDDSVVADRFSSCKNRNCLTMENSILGYCSRSTISKNIQKFIPKHNDYLCIKDNEYFYEELYKYINNKHFMESCRYCYGTDAAYLVEPAIQL